ncbi:MAG: methyltransferase [Defluviitaleaceae bacterium]|nr:methyltransferase [Defluviitaleaceae bacterium]
MDLNRNGLKIVQNSEYFCFGMDSVLLAASAKAYKNQKVVDLCCGVGVVPILMHARHGRAFYTGVEIDEYAYSLACRNVELNGLSDNIQMIRSDIRQDFGLPDGCADVVTVNPPYFEARNGRPLSASIPTARDTARAEHLCTIADVAQCAARLLKFGGKLYIVYRADRLVQVLETLSRHDLTPKHIRYVHTYLTSPSKLFILTAVKSAAAGIVVASPLIIYDSPGVYSKEVNEVYNS